MSGLLSAPPSSPTYRRSRRTFARRCERACCGVLTYFPLVFVYGSTTWAAWVQFKMGMLPEKRLGYASSVIGMALYILLNWSYTTAVFTDPGSPAKSDIRTADIPLASVTVKSTGGVRYCKKCQERKPDRAHHCSTCRRCVLKMDHHCPWLATCVGLRNYKAFLLFLAYTSLFCWLCFAVSGSWVWHEVMVDGQMDEGSVMPIHFVMLSVVSGIIGLVLSGFTAWHVYLTAQNRTTIESLEKTRYLSPVRSHVSHRIHQHHTHDDDQNHSLGEQLRDLGNILVETHANALPGVLRHEEGEERQSPALDSLRQNVQWDSYSRRREQEQYNEYLDERDNAKLPNAFHLGWKRNIGAVLGPNGWLWPLPICNSIGDGWVWEPNPQWLRERARLKQEREIETRRLQEQGNIERIAQHPQTLHVEAGLNNADRMLEGRAVQYAHSSLSSSLAGPRQAPRRSASPVADGDTYDSSDDELLSDSRARLLGKARTTENWNDVPDDMVNGRRVKSRD